MRLEGRKALVTGASRGIGQAIALAYADEGADVAITAARSADALEAVRAEVEARGRKCMPMVWDVPEVGRARDRLCEASGALGGLDIVVNNAGVVRLPEQPGDHDAEAEWDYVIDTNLKGVWFLTEEAARLMAEAGGGVIVNIASDIAFRGASSVYAVSKWGVVGLTRGLGRKWAGRGVRINAVAPGPVATEMIAWHEGDPLENERLPLGRLTLPEEVASVALFLASDDAAAVIGETVVLNTGNP
ncbi:MAG: SDR family NAD(P)-dependent oxidoreductase [Armatimonadota bacterium]